MMWIGLLAGVVLGAAIAGLEGAVVGGFVGWLGGVIVQSHRTQAKGGAAPAKESFEERMQRLERTVADLQARLARIEPRVIDAEAAPGTTTAAAAETTTSAAAETTTTGAPPSPPPIPPARAQPNPIVAWLTGGNTIARVGLLILFFGLAFLLKYAADHSMLPDELRVAAVAAGGLALLVVGWRLRQRRPGYALGMQGAGVAVLYLTTFAALRLSM